MRLRRTLTATAALALAIGTAVIVAPSATADSTWSGTVTTSSTNIQSGYAVLSSCADWFTAFNQPVYSASMTFTPTASGTYAFTVTAATMNGVTPPNVSTLTLFTGSYSQVNCLASNSTDGGFASVSATLTGGTTYLLVFWASSAGQGGIQTTGTFSVSTPGGGSAGATQAAPPPWIQAFARASQDAPCPAGWNPSWEQWPNGGKGGFVCNRSIKSVG